VKRILALVVCAVAVFPADGAEPSINCTPPDFPLPKFGPAKVTVRDFGAKADGVTNDTAAINEAIEKCNATGGGDVIFPAGTYLAASIHLKSNVRFLLDTDAVITGAPRGYDPPEPNPSDKYQDFGHSHFHNALMWGENIQNFAIVGGRVNGGQIVEGDPKRGDIGDKVIALKSSQNLLFQNVTHETGGHFVYLLNDCQNVTIANVTIKKSRDGVNLVSCRNVQVHGCNFTGCGDDTLALKSDYALGRKIDSENIYVWNCYLETACNALQIGAETVGNFRNVNFWNIRIGRAWKAAIGATSADGAIIDGVTYRNITIRDAACPILLRVTGKLRSGEPIKKVGAIRNVTISNVTVVDCKKGEEGFPRACFMSGQPDSPLENIKLENVTITYRGGGTEQQAEIVVPESGHNSGNGLGPLPASGFYIRHIKELTFKDVDVRFEKPDARPLLSASDMDRFELDGLKSKEKSGVVILRLEKVHDLAVRRCPGLRDRTSENVTSPIDE
jgi:polygalacturonase